MIFKYKAYSNLLRDLGRADYVIELSEIAARDFIKQMNETKSPEEFLKEKSQLYGILVSYDSSNTFQNQIILGYIATVYHLTENFFYELQSEYNQFSSEKWSFVSGKTKLDQVITFIKNKGRINHKDFIDDYLIDTFSYYHQLRVFFSHKSTTSENEIKNKWKKAHAHYNEVLLNKYRINSGPKILNQIDFEDFFLFTQISKELALKISSLCYPPATELAKKKEIKKLNKYRSNKEKHYQGIENWLKTEYGFVKENDSDILVDEIIAEL
ncbi:hypothetical protein [Aureispira sp. CCB-E]|uniref:hypothetical protein n=1 Tax=Aureispira sp. CCB-E TaxID=3051121 RepID=UPI00286944E3|nr:hypothetical protein [Aureispira sp. CCB-E]WMX12386.1 hypothetical protein QP953_16270 [Aureispira sp. CCB-E]